MRVIGFGSRDDTEVLQRCGGYIYEQGKLRGRVGKERGGKETDRYPLTPLAQYPGIPLAGSSWQRLLLDIWTLYSKCR
jgi:hypothetical protein